MTRTESIDAAKWLGSAAYSGTAPRTGLTSGAVLFRRVVLEDIQLPVSVSHAALDGGDRIDSAPVRVDVLRLSIDVLYVGDQTLADQAGTAGVFWHAPLYRAVAERAVEPLTGPLETIHEAVLDVVEASARVQRIALVSATVTALRTGLVAGAPRLISHRSYGPAPAAVEARAYRSAGMVSMPLQIAVDHSWCIADDQVEHVPVRHDPCVFDFEAMVSAVPLGNDLGGLMNYARTWKAIQALQGTVVRGPVEVLCDRVIAALALEADTLGLNPLRLRAGLKRGAYARATPKFETLVVYHS